MTREEFNNLRVGQIIIAYTGEKYKIDSIDEDIYPTKAYYVRRLKDGNIAYACMYDSWKLGHNIVKLGGKYDNRGV